MVKLYNYIPLLLATLALSAPAPPGPPSPTDILPIDLTQTLGPLLTIDLARVIEAILAGVTTTLLDLPLIEELGEFLHGAGEELICGTNRALCDTLEQFCAVGKQQGGGGSGGDPGLSGGSGGGSGSGYALPPPSRDSLMGALGGDPMGYLNEWIGSHYSPASSPPSGPPSPLPPSGPPRSSGSGPPPTDPGCHCSTIPPPQGQQLQSWISNQGNSVDPDILSSLQLCAIGGIAEAISEHARELLLEWLEECPLEEAVKDVVEGWCGVGGGVSEPISGSGGSEVGPSSPPVVSDPVFGSGGTQGGPSVSSVGEGAHHGPPSHGFAWKFGGGAGGWRR